MVGREFVSADLFTEDKDETFEAGTRSDDSGSHS